MSFSEIKTLLESKKEEDKQKVIKYFGDILKSEANDIHDNLENNKIDENKKQFMKELKRYMLDKMRGYRKPIKGNVNNGVTEKTLIDECSRILAEKSLKKGGRKSKKNNKSEIKRKSESKRKSKSESKSKSKNKRTRKYK
jgi:hypothetical protein